jgi:hypothetical protein
MRYFVTPTDWIPKLSWGFLLYAFGVTECVYLFHHLDIGFLVSFINDHDAHDKGHAYDRQTGNYTSTGSHESSFRVLAPRKTGGTP